MKPPPVGPLVLVAVVFANLTGVAVNIIPPQRTVAERVATMDAVLRVRPISEPTVRAEDLRPSLQEANPDVVFPSPLLTPVIEQNVEVLEVIKGFSFAVVGTTIRIGTSGGHNGMHLDSDWRRRTLSLGSTYVVFMSEHPWSKQLRYSYFDIFRLDDPRITMPNEAPYGRALLRLNALDALDFVREAVTHTPPTPRC
jgi:hypothetical protein